MSLEQDRAADRERRAARIFGGKRHVRADKGRAPDVLPFALPTSGDVVQIEVKNGMRRVPRILAKALEQARSYTPEAVPVAVFSDVGGSEIACVPAKDLARWLGVAPEKITPVLLKKRKAKRPFKQLALFPAPSDDPPCADVDQP